MNIPNEQAKKVPLHIKQNIFNNHDDFNQLNESKILESLDNLDMLLANFNSKNGKKYALNKLIDKFGIKNNII